MLPVPRALDGRVLWFALWLPVTAAAGAAQAPEDGAARLGPGRAYAGAPVVDADAEAPRRVLRPLQRVADFALRHGIHRSTQLVTDVSAFATERIPARRRAVRGRSLATVALHADLDSLVGWPGARVRGSLLALAGPDETATLGAAHGGTSIDAPAFRGLGELWLEQRLGDDRVVAKLGRMDANTQFAAAQHAGSFLTPGAGLDPTVFPMPTYPIPALGLTAGVRLGAHAQLSAGVFDGHPAAALAMGVERRRLTDALFGIGELALQGPGVGAHDARLALGAWRHTGDFRPLYDGVGAPLPATAAAHGAHGAYAVVDHQLHVVHDGDVTRTLGAFVQLGWAAPHVADVARHAGVGVAWTGPFARRAHDGAGLAFSAVALGDFGAAARGTRRGAVEHEVEAFYHVQVAPWAALVSDVKVVFRPGGRADARPAAALTLRSVLTR